MNRYFIALLLTFLIACKANRNHNLDQDILGQWKNKSRDASVPIISFHKEGYIFFGCRSDTVFYVGYTIHKDSLFIKPYGEDSTYKTRIIKLNKNKLILKSLYKDEGKQIFIRDNSTE